MSDRNTRRDFLDRAARTIAKVGVVGAVAAGLGIKSVQDADAITCSCGPASYNGAFCATNSQGLCTGWLKYLWFRHYNTGTQGTCGAGCQYYTSGAYRTDLCPLGTRP